MLKIAHSSAYNSPPFSGLLTIKLIIPCFDEVPKMPDKCLSVPSKMQCWGATKPFERKKGRNVTSLRPFLTIFGRSYSALISVTSF